MDVSAATTDDLDVIRRLYRDFMAEWPPPAYLGDVIENELAEVDGAVASERAFLAEEAGETLGFALAWPTKRDVGYLSDLYVRPNARGHGVGAAIMRVVAAALRERGVRHLT